MRIRLDELNLLQSVAECCSVLLFSSDEHSIVIEATLVTLIAIFVAGLGLIWQDIRPIASMRASQDPDKAGVFDKTMVASRRKPSQALVVVDAG